MSSRYIATLESIWCCVSGNLTNVNPLFTPILALFWPPPSPEGMIWQLNCQLVDICLPFGSGQVAYRGFIRAFFAKNICLI